MIGYREDCNIKMIINVSWEGKRKGKEKKTSDS
jgi:hypothetical protein